MSYEWDPAKNLANMAKHGIDFLDATEVFDVVHLVLPSFQKGEERWKAIGNTLHGLITVIYTLRGEKIRLISARKARDNERREYCQLYG